MSNCWWNRSDKSKLASVLFRKRHFPLRDSTEWNVSRWRNSRIHIVFVGWSFKQITRSMLCRANYRKPTDWWNISICAEDTMRDVKSNPSNLLLISLSINVFRDLIIGSLRSNSRITHSNTNRRNWKKTNGNWRICCSVGSTVVLVGNNDCLNLAVDSWLASLFLFADRVSLSCPVWLALKKRFYWHFTRAILPTSINIESFVLLSRKKCQQSNEKLSDNDEPFENATIDRFLARDDRLANEFQQRNHRSLISSRLNPPRLPRLSDGSNTKRKESRWFVDETEWNMQSMTCILFYSSSSSSQLLWFSPRWIASRLESPENSGSRAVEVESLSTLVERKIKAVRNRSLSFPRMFNESLICIIIIIS